MHSRRAMTSPAGAQQVASVCRSVRRAPRQVAPACFTPQHNQCCSTTTRYLHLCPSSLVASHGRHPVLQAMQGWSSQGSLSLLHAGCLPHHQQRSRSVPHPFAPESRAIVGCHWKLLSGGGCAHLHLCLRSGSAGGPADPESRWHQDRPFCTPLLHSALLKHRKLRPTSPQTSNQYISM